MNIPHLGELSAFLCAVCWSVAVIAFRVAGDEIRSFHLTVFKTIAAALFFLLALGASRLVDASWPWVPALSGRDWALLLASAFFGITVGDVLFIMALKRLGAGLVAIVDCFYAPLTIVVAYLLFGETVPGTTLLGGGLVVSALFIGSERTEGLSLAREKIVEGSVLALLSTVVMVVAALMIRDIFRTHNVLWVVGFRFTAAALMYGVWSLLRRDFHEVVRIRRLKSLRPLLLGSLLGPFLATLFWFVGFKYTLAGNVAILTQLSTVFIFLLGAAVLGEPLTRRRVAAVALAVAGALVVQL
ncbi:MAG: DMT family transporter [Elusimicrobia bacterium]|nr:DMT family transporter [Elusimicrobiota bacterium]